MPFNGSGVFSIVNTFTPGTTISSSAMNGNFSDIALGLSDCLTRDGQAPMTAALKLINGNSSTPSMAFASEPTLGIYRSGAGILSVAGDLGVTGDAAIAGDLAVTGAITHQGGNPLLPVGMVSLWSGNTAPALWVLAGATYSRTTYASLWTFANAQIALGNTLYGIGDGTTTFTIGTMDGYAPVGVDGAGTTLPSVTHVGDTTGNKTSTLLTANLPAYTPSGSVTSTPTVGGAIIGTSVGGTTGGAQTTPVGQGGLAINSSFTGTAQGGTSTPVAIVQPSRAFKFIVYAGV